MIRSHEELEVCQVALDGAMEIFEASKRFPREETHSLTDQIRRSSRSVCGIIGKAWRKRRYQAAFVSKLNDAESEAAETGPWIKFAVKREVWKPEMARELHRTYDHIIGKLVKMIVNPHPWLLDRRNR